MSHADRIAVGSVAIVTVVAGADLVISPVVERVAEAAAADLSNGRDREKNMIVLNYLGYA